MDCFFLQKIGKLTDYGQEKFEVILNIFCFWIPVGCNCCHTASAELRVEWGHYAHQRLYWYNATNVQYTTNLLH